MCIRAWRLCRQRAMAFSSEARERLCEQFPALCEPPDSNVEALPHHLDALAGGAWRRLATSRQQLLATVVMMGINRIVVSKR